MGKFSYFNAILIKGIYYCIVFLLKEQKNKKQDK